MNKDKFECMMGYHARQLCSVKSQMDEYSHAGASFGLLVRCEHCGKTLEFAYLGAVRNYAQLKDSMRLRGITASVIREGTQLSSLAVTTLPDEWPQFKDLYACEVREL